ncbi:MAG: sugar ABC transporter ATP-binding protein [Synergistales bacterium]|nr:sugar ABC transporter ATP-binding protein [Synergistales bacterium]MDY6401080.1 sugar ABC transporter ATP-binding protein [Synergistales bacterium]MDY6404673.1 sugar ABC transporter ATP-binding protein [Synergistales bacterium]MDY6410911.1 sugar ABC transporter ATP-binding protein [Synergistales bacterium]MDY6415118.1 sugar ABC transporter ATP-binding protein [Synergistales bacterium]
MSDNNNAPLLQLDHIGKEYYGNRVLSDISFSIEAGEILGLVGENGAGKSTLLNILFGMPVISSTGGYEGSLYLDGKQVNFTSPTQALAAGIGMVHQEFSLIPGFTATENILLNREVLNGSLMSYVFSERVSTLDRDAMKARASEAIKTLGVHISPDMTVNEMPVGYKQFIEIAREIDRKNTRLLFLDEPTAVLTEQEADILLIALGKLAKSGIGIVFISHRLNEVKTLCDRILVLRDGKLITDQKASGLTTRQIASLMVGRESLRKEDPVEIPEHPVEEANVNDALTTTVKKKKKKPALKVEHLWVDMPGETVRDVSFEVQKGEIFGIGGLAGHGKLGIPNGIMGLYPAGGKVRLFGKKLTLNRPRAALGRKMAFVSEDRRGVGLLLDEPLDWNITFTAMQMQGRFLIGIPHIFQLRNELAMAKETRKFIESLSIKCTGPNQKAGELSGGNQQKVCLAKAFVLRPDILLICEPTRGIDIGAKTLVLDTLKEYNKEHGTTIIITSSELEELRSVCDRVAIVDEGKIAGVLPASSPAEEFGMLMMGEKLRSALAFTE